MRWSMLLLCWCSAIAFAQPAWKPDRPVEIIIGAAPGGANDRIGRSLQRGLQDGKYANPVIVMNKPGGGQTIAFSYLAAHPASPYYLGLASSSWLTTVAAGGTSVTLKDVTPIVKVLDEYQVYFVRNDSAIRSAKDIIDRLKKDPGALSFGFSTARGNPLHL